MIGRLTYYAACWGLVLLALLGCDRQPDGAGAGAARPGGPPARPVVVTSVFPIGSLLQDLAGSWADVHTLLPPGQSPHSFEPTAAQVIHLSQADLVVLVGMGLDPWAKTALASLNRANLRVIQITDLTGIKTDGAGDEHEHAHSHEHEHAAEGEHDEHPDHEDDDGHDHSGPNPHVWLDPVLTAQFTGEMADELAVTFPAHAGEISTAKARVLAELAVLDREFVAGLGGLANKRMVTFHNSFDLLAERYGLEVVAHLTQIHLNPGGEVRPDNWVKAADALRRFDLKVVYVEPQMPAQAIAALEEAAGVKALRVEELGNPNLPGYRTYFEMMRTNLATIRQGQGGAAATQPAQPTTAPAATTR